MQQPGKHYSSITEQMQSSAVNATPSSAPFNWPLSVAVVVSGSGQQLLLNY